ncbi:MAG: glucose-1-phosphate adenylyltransferase [Candidatus Sumerlaeia bacterium]|nr:glucose-1-phosphate adenylyltransferase [Candidatus Sumerlaeia bacterium]
MRVLAMILAGGKGQRLFPLTRHRTKPAVPFGGNYRIVDFALSNLVNSGIHAIYVLVQYRSQSLIEHLRTGWLGRGIGIDAFITVVPPQMRHGELWYRGSADAVAQNLNLVQTFQPDAVAIFAGDLVFRMDVTQMLARHREWGAEVTLACSPVPLAQARKRLGVAKANADGLIEEFVEKPDNPQPMRERPDCAFASMGCYLFQPDVLVEVLMRQAGQSASPTDLSRDVFPQLVARGRAWAYNFEANEIPDRKPYEQRGYWCDVGTIGSYWAAHMDLLGPQPLFDLRNMKWPIYPARATMPPTSFLSAVIEDSLVGEGGRIERATLRRSVVGRGVVIEPEAVIEESIIMEHTHIGAGAVIRRAILDRFNEIPPGAHISPESAASDPRCHLDRAANIVVLPRGGIAAPPEDLPMLAAETDGLGAF